MKYLIFLFFPLLFISCEYLQLKQEKEDRTIIASVGDVDLYHSDLEGVIPSKLNGNDSVVIAKSYINSWAKQQLLLEKAKENISEVKSNEIEALVDDYKESLYVNGYKERLINQQLDTVVKPIETLRYYKNNKQNFKLNEILIKVKFICFGKDFLDKDEVVKMFKSENREDLEELENLTINFKDYNLPDSGWITYDEFIKRIPLFANDSKEKLLNVSKFIQKEDSLGVYLVAVKEVLKRNDIAPMSYTEGNIKQLILHKRKLQLIRDIEKKLINDAIEQNNFKEY